MSQTFTPHMFTAYHPVINLSILSASTFLCFSHKSCKK